MNWRGGDLRKEMSREGNWKRSECEGGRKLNETCNGSSDLIGQPVDLKLLNFTGFVRLDNIYLVILLYIVYKEKRGY